MELSANAARALQQVEMGLYMLYGASYFTEDEWIKLDGLIHKGQYVFTSGPPQQNFLEDELMSFDDFSPANASFGAIKQENNQQQTSSASPLGINGSPVEISTATSAEASSDDGSAKKYELFDFSETTTPTSAGASTPGAAQKAPNDLFEFAERHTPSPFSAKNVTSQETESNDLSEFCNPTEPLTEPEELPTEPPTESEEPTTEPASAHVEPILESAIAVPVESHEATPEPDLPPTSESFETTPESFEPPKREAKSIPKEGGLAYYTQAQLDELKAFNASLTKAGEKSKSKSKRADQRHEEHARVSPQDFSYSEQGTVQEETSYDQGWAAAVSPTTAEHDSRIQSWASEINVQDVEVVSPSPQNTTNSSTQSAIVEKFVEVHGRAPKNSNDISQPNNPNFRPLDQRSDSRASNRTSIKSSAKAASLGPKRGSGTPELNLVNDTILIAQGAFIAKSKIQIDVHPGDKVRIIKHVSGITYVGETLHNGLKGQFPDTIFKRTSAQDGSTLLEQQRVIARRGQRAPSVVTIGPEVMNAAAWEAESVISKARAPPLQPNASRGLATSRYAALDDLASDQQKQVEELARLEVSKMVDQRVAQILAANSRTGVKAPVKEPLKVVPPKTETCWWWKTPGKDCRFAAHECRDAHYFIPPALAEAANLRMGKPTWGALADQLPPTSPAPPTGPSYSNSKIGLKTCWYWENDTCTNSPEECKYLHEYSPAGVADKPHHSWKRRPPMRNWRSDGNRGGTEVGEGSVWGDVGEESHDGQSEMVVEEAKDGGDWGTDDWGMSRAGGSAIDDSGLNDDKYKAPHLRALEHRVSATVNGW